MTEQDMRRSHGKRLVEETRKQQETDAQRDFADAKRFEQELQRRFGQDVTLSLIAYVLACDAQREINSAWQEIELLVRETKPSDLTTASGVLIVLNILRAKLDTIERNAAAVAVRRNGDRVDA